MKKTLYIIVLLNLFQHSSIKSQNLIPNPSFETISNCPYGPDLIYYAPPWFQPSINSGNTTNSSSSDLFNSCYIFTGAYARVGVPSSDFGYQLARTGDGYAGILIYADSMKVREYIEVPLISPPSRECRQARCVLTRADY